LLPIETLERRAYLSVIPTAVLDPAFGAAGTSHTPILSDNVDYFSAVALERDGSIVAAGWNHPQFAGADPADGLLVTRHRVDGQADAGFGREGTGQVVIPTFTFHDPGEPVDLVIQRDGKIVLAFPTTGGIAFLRLRPDGSTDTSFGSSGTGQTFVPVAGDSLVTSSAVLRRGGQVLVAGSVRIADARHHRQQEQMLFAQVNADGTIDTTFGDRGTGVSVVGTKYDDVARALTLDTDGTIVAAGGSRGDFALVRLTPGGRADPSFGSSGMTTADFGAPDEIATGVVALGPGGVYVAGSTAGDVAVVHFKQDGRLEPGTAATARLDFGGAHDVVASLFFRGTRHLDSLFVVGGPSDATDGQNARFAVADLNVGDGAEPRLMTDYGDHGIASIDIGPGPDAPAASAMYRDGRIVIAGGTPNTAGGHAKLARLTPGSAIAGRPGGTPDPGFAGNGKVSVARQSPARFEIDDTLALPGGKLAVVGSTYEQNQFDALFVRVFDASGSPDDAFGVGGVVFPQLPYPIFTARAAVRADGKIVIAAQLHEINLVEPNAYVTLIRLNPDGSPDTSFAPGGIRRLPDPAPAAPRIAVDGAGRFCLATTDTQQWVITRRTAAGDLDPTFGDGSGTASVSFAGYAYSTVSDAPGILPDGRIIMAGSVAPSNTDLVGAAFAAARLTAGGQLDTTYGTLGKTVVTFDAPGAPTSDVLDNATLFTDGSILFAGSSNLSGDGRRAMVKLTPDGLLDSSFGQGGKVLENPTVGPDTTPGLPNDAITRVATLPNGRILAVATSVSPSAVRQFLIRYTAAGRPDPTFGVGGSVELAIPQDAHFPIADLQTRSDGRVLATGYDDAQLLLALLA